MKAKEPVQEFFSIGDVCTLTDLKPHVLRYWESQFKFLHPAKNRSGNRVYQRREIEQDRSLLNRTVDETLRFEPTGPHVARWMAQDFECYGTTIPAGSARGHTV